MNRGSAPLADAVRFQKLSVNPAVKTLPPARTLPAEASSLFSRCGRGRGLSPDALARAGLSLRNGDDNARHRQRAIAAAKDISIPVWELQHGFLGPEHMGYMYEQDAVGPDRAALPFPDRFLAYGDFFREMMERSAYCSAGAVDSIGFPRLDYFRRSISPTRWSRRPFRVLVSNQWIYSEAISNFLVDVAAKMPDCVELVVKPHPSDSRETLAYYQKSIPPLRLLPKEMSFYDALAGVHLHVAVSSTTLFESVGLGIPTCVLALPGWSNASALVEKNAAALQRDPGSFAEFLRELVDDRDAYQRLIDRAMGAANYFWTSNAGGNLHQLLADIQPSPISRCASETGRRTSYRRRG